MEKINSIFDAIVQLNSAYFSRYTRTGRQLYYGFDELNKKKISIYWIRFEKKSKAKYAMNIAQLKCHFFVPAVDSVPC